MNRGAHPFFHSRLILEQVSPQGQKNTFGPNFEHVATNTYHPPSVVFTHIHQVFFQQISWENSQITLSRSMELFMLIAKRRQIGLGYRFKNLYCSDVECPCS